MKFILFSFFFIPILSFSQIPNGVHQIVVNGVSFFEVCNSLLDSGYTIKEKDNDLQTAVTREKQFPKYWNATYHVEIRVKDSTAYITGKVTSPLSSNEPIEYVIKRGKEFSKGLLTYPFILINNFAKGFERPISYKQ